MGNIYAANMYSRGTVEISHCKKSDLTNTVKFGKCVELGVFWIRIEELRLQNQEIERKLIWSTAHYSFKIFCLTSCFLKACWLKYKRVCVCVCVCVYVVVS